MPMKLTHKVRSFLCANKPREAAQIGFTAPVEITAAAEPKEGETAKRPTFSIVAYSGGPMQVGAFYYPVIVELSGLKASRKRLPILLDHDASRIVGQADQITIDAKSVRLEGAITGDDADAQKVLAHARNGFEWQASIGASVDRVERLEAGKTATVNGREVTGPMMIVRAATLKETSFVAIGADDTTSASVAASSHASEIDMDFETWLQAKGFDAASLTAESRTFLKAQYDNEHKGDPGKPQDVAASADAGKPDDPAAGIRAAAAAELRRIDEIRTLCAQHGDPKIKVGENEVPLAAHATEQGWDATKVELEAIRASRGSAPAIGTSRPTLNGSTIEAAICQSAGMSGLEKHFDTPTLEAADKHFRGRLGLQELLVEAARSNGYHGYSFDRDPQGVMRAAFVQASGFSTFSLPGILSNVANKFLLAGFMSIEDAWRQIAATRSVNDFKAITSYRLTGGFEYDEVGPDGELKHAAVGEESFSNRAKTYGKMFGLTRTDIINDDMGALTAVPQRIGRGAALKLNKVFWAVFMNNSDFFKSGNNNYLSGANSALGVDGLTAAETSYLNQTDPDGNPLAISPAILLVPNALNVIATQLVRDTEIRDTTASKKYTTGNPHAGKFRVVRSSYLSSTAITGNSTTAWYLLADPSDLPTIEVAFLNGRQVPVVESADADFNVLGVQMRGYHDFGVAKQDHRGGLKSAGA